MKPQVLERLKRIVEPDLSELEKNLIFPESDGYRVFRQYFITTEEGAIKVFKNESARAVFSSIKTALSWCVSDKYSQRRLRDEIEHLDAKRMLLRADLAVRSASLGKGTKRELRAIAEDKINERKYRLKRLDLQLDKCINLAKYWQLRGFNNETSRTGQQPSHRTSR